MALVRVRCLRRLHEQDGQVALSKADCFKASAPTWPLRCLTLSLLSRPSGAFHEHPADVCCSWSCRNPLRFQCGVKPDYGRRAAFLRGSQSTSAVSSDRKVVILGAEGEQGQLHGTKSDCHSRRGEIIALQGAGHRGIRQLCEVAGWRTGSDQAHYTGC